jgi:chorismate mutase / prephenate dehydratase
MPFPYHVDSRHNGRDPMEPGPEPRSLEAIRRDIDEVDRRLVELLGRRVELASEVGRLKGRDGRPFFTPEREREIYDRLRRENRGAMSHDGLRAVFREIISAARAAEKPLSVAYWGPAGTFSHAAALETFGSSTGLDPRESIRDVFVAVERGHADYGVVPVENSVAGVVPETLDMFPQTNVKICAETYLPIHHQLLGTADRIEDVERVYAGPQPFQQCRNWLREHLPNAEVVEVVPTSRAAESARKDSAGAAIGNRLAGEMYGLGVLAEHIQDDPHNRTRFLVIGYNEPAKTGNDKTSVMFNLRNRPGELVKALRAFEAHGVNLMMIESRPAPRASFEYIFYVDCAGHRADVALQRAMEELKTAALETTVLGSYPSAEE